MKRATKLTVVCGAVFICFAIASPSIMAELNGESPQLMEQQGSKPIDDLVKKAFKRAREYDRKMEIEKAIGEYTKIIEMQPDHLDAYYYRSTIMVYVDPEKAIEDARKAQELFEKQGNQEAADSMEVHIETIRDGVERGSFKMPQPISEQNN